MAYLIKKNWKTQNTLNGQQHKAEVFEIYGSADASKDKDCY